MEPMVNCLSVNFKAFKGFFFGLSLKIQLVVHLSASSLNKKGFLHRELGV